MSCYKEFGKSIKKLRQQRGLKGSEFAVQVDVNYTSLSSIEKGTELPTVAVAVNMANYFGVSIDDCVKGSFNDTSTALIRGALQKMSESDLEMAYRFLQDLKCILNEVD